jgi:hypothetical protein
MLIANQERNFIMSEEKETKKSVKKSMKRATKKCDCNSGASCCSSESCGCAEEKKANNFEDLLKQWNAAQERPDKKIKEKCTTNRAERFQEQLLGLAFAYPIEFMHFLETMREIDRAMNEEEQDSPSIREEYITETDFPKQYSVKEGDICVDVFVGLEGEDSDGDLCLTITCTRDTPTFQQKMSIFNAYPKDTTVSELYEDIEHEIKSHMA